MICLITPDRLQFHCSQIHQQLYNKRYDFAAGMNDVMVFEGNQLGLLRLLLVQIACYCNIANVLSIRLDNISFAYSFPIFYSFVSRSKPGIAFLSHLRHAVYAYFSFKSSEHYTLIMAKWWLREKTLMEHRNDGLYN